MGKLFDNLRQAVAAERYIFSDHADERLRQREIMRWQVIAGFNEARLLSERPESKPHPSVEVEQILADGTPVKAVWSLVVGTGFAKLVTIHFFDRRTSW